MCVRVCVCVRVCAGGVGCVCVCVCVCVQEKKEVDAFREDKTRYRYVVLCCTLCLTIDLGPSSYTQRLFVHLVYCKRNCRCMVVSRCFVENEGNCWGRRQEAHRKKAEDDAKVVLTFQPLIVISLP